MNPVSVCRGAGLVAIIALAGCAGSNARPAIAAVPQKSYAQSLAVCRHWHSGRQNQHRALAPTDSHIAACLRRFGWHPDGVPTLESVAPAEGAAPRTTDTGPCAPPR